LNGEQELRLLVETIPTPVWRAAPEGNVEYVNKRALVFGAPADEILRWGWIDKVHPDDIAFKKLAQKSSILDASQRGLQISRS